ncbi:conserved membrane hypothetical protein [Candidatus Sulfotelmatomonas gaucii]|uniref:DUF3147 family protein n=1 Tax=Candidatus Sulfuritelmatomonas gaucii TaxID=2043161 RepID=A0A2N9L949_9BACT|nr:conserved membrane hypothetical protein [Candidatus Sulfotelmatomonas gaucii]
MISARISSLKETKPHEYLIRFAFGGGATVLAGFIAMRFGPGPGGLFLAFPAIFPATATLIEAHEKKRMAKIGHDGTNRGRMAASIDAAGASLGCIGLAGFAVILWLMLPKHNAFLYLVVALAVWVVLSVVLWKVRKSRLFGIRFGMSR